MKTKAQTVRDYIKGLKAKIVVLRDALDIAAERIATMTGSCPQDTEDWDRPEGCDIVCDSGIEKGCWKMYFESEALNKT